MNNVEKLTASVLDKLNIPFVAYSDVAKSDESITCEICGLPHIDWLIGTKAFHTECLVGSQSYNKLYLSNPLYPGYDVKLPKGYIK